MKDKRNVGKRDRERKYRSYMNIKRQSDTGTESVIKGSIMKRLVRWSNEIMKRLSRYNNEMMKRLIRYKHGDANRHRGKK